MDQGFFKIRYVDGVRNTNDLPNAVRFFRGKTILDAVELETPPWERESIGFWVDLPIHILEQIRMHGIDSAAAIHAAEHAFLIQFSLSQDVKTDCRVSKEEDTEEDAHTTKRNPRYPR